MFNFIPINSNILTKYSNLKIFNLCKNQIIPIEYKTFSFNSNSLVYLKKGIIKINMEDDSDNNCSILIKKIS